MTDASPGQAREALRQQALLAAIADPGGAAATPWLTEGGDRARQGLEAYRANARASVCSALEGTFPTVRKLVGDAGFGFLARAFHSESPPHRGDLGEWGDGFGPWLGARPELVEWPYLEDCASLDLAVHRCERAADAVFDAASMSCLAQSVPAALRLHLMPGAAVLRSRWPIATIHAAHRHVEPELEAVRRALADGRGESVQVVREGWRAVVHEVDAATFTWTASLLAGDDLGTALERAGAGFDLSAWLAAALAAGWLQGASSSVATT